MSRREGDADLESLPDQGSSEAIADGTAGKLSLQWFGFDVVPR